MLLIWPGSSAAPSRAAVASYDSCIQLQGNRTTVPLALSSACLPGSNHDPLPLLGQRCCVAKHLALADKIRHGGLFEGGSVSNAFPAD